MAAAKGANKVKKPHFAAISTVGRLKQATYIGGWGFCTGRGKHETG
jgi:hypothetical protein